MLATQFSGRWEETLKRCNDGKIFLDYDADEFRLILKELRRCQIDPSRQLTMPDTSVEDLWTYLGLPVPVIFTEKRYLVD